ncbi:MULTISPECIES: hypothetical protein [Brevibacillus]|jgi:hypothetical protein|uniref:hypothetical protein n=1 Tax=Brevibacillus TaxID=55080 RepID=UPI0004F2F8BB|nr:MULTISPECIES: hypothetical protein [Brevibacillus]KKX52404.1 hypothetical protein X546_25480 [Brevibacillus borstelensis cifa_chp40]MCM3558282.1 hypothetical protein [Brevibacillus borstelensis]MCM3625374.1 hypothetical protein [Brevibacillus borstelensis]MED1726255.1 hypothetical protein [Brevibacillus parabrevis]MED1742496.1 hypothetical protein [Brevibacillus borstelensis]
MKRLPLDTVLTLMRRENVLGYGSDMDELACIFAKHVTDTLSQEQAELSLAHYLAKSTHKDVIHRNQVLAKVTRFLNQYGWNLSDYHKDYYRKYFPLFG